MVKINWEHMITRRLAVQVGIAWNYGLGKYCKIRYGTGITNFLVYYDGKKTDYYIDKNNHVEFNKQLDSLLDNRQYVYGLVPEAKEFLHEQYEFIKEFVKDHKNIDNKELAKLFRKLIVYHGDFYSRMWMIFRICERIIMKIEGILINNNLDRAKVQEITRTLSIPLKPNDSMNERIDLLRIAASSNIFTRSTRIKEHTKRFRHIPMFDYDHLPFSETHFQNELELIKNPMKEHKEIEESIIKRKKDFELILEEISPDNRLLSLIQMLKKAVILRDHRDMIRQKLNLCLREFYADIGSRLSISVEETALLTDEEIISSLDNSKEFDKREIDKRKDAFLLLQLNDNIELFSGEDAKSKAKELIKTQNNEHHTKLSNIKGIIGSTGKVTGRARVMNTNLDLKNITSGDIMIATMTRQDFVPYMRKCKGIITNEGGVTCHAAIIARELKVPCLVGTISATKIFNDGEMIELDANTGIARKI